VMVRCGDRILASRCIRINPSISIYLLDSSFYHTKDQIQTDHPLSLTLCFCTFYLFTILGRSLSRFFLFFHLFLSLCSLPLSCSSLPLPLFSGRLVAVSEVIPPRCRHWLHPQRLP
jgi:hypothetical protein